MKPKKHKSKYKKKEKRQVQKVAPQQQKVKKSTRLPILNNVVVGIIFLAIIFYARSNNMGYKWLTETLIGKNLETIYQNKDINFDQKLEAKLGMNLRYLNFIKANTPEQAIILMPPDEVIMSENAQSTGLGKDLKNKVWTSYYLYPRKIVYEREKATSPIYKDATHVAIVNNWGYEKLDYQANQSSGLTVLPIKNQSSQ